jgi:hypothetical protein
MKKVIKFLFVVERKLGAEDGSTIVLSLLVLVLLAAFVALAVTRSVNETIATTNDAAETRAFSAAEASLEVMTRTFKKIFDEKLAPEAPDLLRVQNTSPLNFSPGEFSDYSFEQLVRQTGNSRIVDIAGGTWKGLKALRDEWMFQTTATDTRTGVQVVLRRWIFNNRIPLFQFGVFYNDDAEFHPGPRFNFGGRVHTNSNIFLMASTGLYFSSKVTASGRVITDVARNGTPWNHWNDQVYIRDASGNYVRLRHCMGSVLTQSYNNADCNSPVSGPPVFGSGYPTLRQNTNWNTYKALFQGNLEDLAPRLDLPIARELGVLSYIQLIKRGKEVGDLHNQGGSIVPVNSTTADSIIVKKERYANKPGIRITLADRKEMLPGCADPLTGDAVTTPCGVRLDGDPSGAGGEASSPADAGYLPKPMADGYQATRVNGYRLRTGGTTINGRQRQAWIKVELVSGINPITGRVDTQDVTEHILSLGVTERPAFASNIQGYGNADSRSIIKIQRFSIPGVQLHTSDNSYYTFLPSSSPISISNPGPLANHNIVALRYSTNNGSTWAGLDTGYSPPDGSVHRRIVNLPSGNAATNLEIVPFPIKMFDAREGLFNESLSSTQLNAIYPNGTVPWAGVMSMIDIDIANLRRFLNGNFDSAMPTINGRRITSSDVPSANGWVLYISDRRGDRDFDGQYDMENVYVRMDSSGRPLESGSDLTLEPGEDVNGNGVLDVGGFTTGEAPRYADRDNNFPYCAFFDHGYYRRGVRLVNGATLPGRLDLLNPANTRGFTVASENAIYVMGNYNATGITSMGDPTPPQNYLPQNTPEHIPASIVADAIIILSNAWQDSRSFRYPFSSSDRQASRTFIRFAMISGDPMSSLNALPNQGGGDPRLAGGIHNFKRFLEGWGGDTAPLHYTGSIINLYNSQVNNGTFKCCNRVYTPPRRDWTFDVSFLDPTRLPPGTPFAHDIQLTGFQRLN